MLAKISSDINKPDGQFAVTFTRDAIMAFNQPLTIRKIPGIGKVSERCLEALGVMVRLPHGIVHTSGR
jgi:DNA polymerase kappa